MPLTCLLRKLPSSPIHRAFTSTMSTRTISSYVVTPSELSSALQKTPAGSRIIPVSGDWYLPNDSRNGYDEYIKLRIPNARFFDQDRVKDLKSPYPHMLPSGETFSRAMQELGIRRDDTVVVYDSPHLGIFSGPRVAWIFRVFGHPKVHLLNNFKLWVERGLPTETGPVRDAAWEKSDYPVVKPDESIVVSFEEMVKHARDGTREGVEIIDARPNGRFLGIDPEPRPELSSGHVPGAISLPFSELVDPTTKTLKSASDLRKIFLAKGIDTSPKTEKLLMCGTGVTAVIIDAALDLAGIEGHKRIYDGSWTEWTQRVDKDSGLIVKKPQ